MQSYVLSIIGTDRAGLVDALAGAVVEHGGSWERGHMTELAGIFAGVALVELPDGEAESFAAALEPLREQGLMEVLLRPAADELAPEAPVVGVDVVGADRPGIVHEVSHLLAGLGVGIVDLQTWTESAAMAGGVLFRAAATVRLPPGVTEGDLTDALEELPDNLMVDLTGE